MTTHAILALADGSVFHGTSIGVSGETVGEVVFNTSMTGYQEMLTDPSYNQQILTLTYPHIGNTGCNPGDQESIKVYAAGLVIRDLPLTYSNWRATESLADYLQRQNIVAIADIDTRQLTRILREKGAQNGCILAGDNLDENRALEKARAFPGLSGMDLAKVVSTNKNYEWTEGTWKLETDSPLPLAGEGRVREYKYHVVAYDFGVKQNILRILADFGCRVTVVPAQTTAQEALALKPDGIFLSNGPGDPAPCDYAIKATQEFLDNNIPLFGICLGHQILGLAVGATTLKMKFGHHGANHPVKDLQTGQVLITAQNHGFAVDENTLPSNVEVTHISLFDGSLQGMRLKDKPAFSFQGHPEASGGPHDIKPLFERFITMMQEKNNNHAKTN